MALPTDFLKQFKSILIEAGKTFDRPPGNVNLEQFNVISRGRLPRYYVRLFGYSKLRNCVCPNANTTKAAQKQMRDLVTKLVKSA